MMKTNGSRIHLADDDDDDDAAFVFESAEGSE